MNCDNYQVCELTTNIFTDVVLCEGCHNLFGQKLEFKEDIECMICYEKTTAVKLFHCDHSICIDCFRRSWYGPTIQYPPFPYPELLDEYKQEPNHLKWMNYASIVYWEIKCFNLDKEFKKQYMSEEYLRKCPVCRI